MKNKLQYFYLCLIVVFVSVNLRFAITSISPVLDMIQTTLGMSNASASLLTSIPVVCTGLFAPLLNTKFIQKFKQEQVLFGMIVLITLGTFARLFANTTIFLIITTILIGVGMALASPIISGMIKKYFPNNTSLMVSVYSVSLAAGASLGSAFTLTITEKFSGYWNVGLAFWSIFGLLAVLWMIPLIFSLKKNQMVIKGEENVEYLESVSPWKSSRAWSVALFFGLQSGLYYALIAWYIPYLKTIGLDAKDASYILTLFATLQIIGNFLFPFLVSIFKRKIFFMYVSTILSLLGMVSLIYLHQAVLSALLFALGTGGMFSLALLLPIDISRNAEEASQYSAMTLSVGYIIGGVVPIILGWIIDLINDIQLSMNILIILILVILGLVYWISQELKRTKTE